MKSHGFTVIELLLVIVIAISLGSLVFLKKGTSITPKITQKLSVGDAVILKLVNNQSVTGMVTFANAHSASIILINPEGNVSVINNLDLSLLTLTK